MMKKARILLMCLLCGLLAPALSGCGFQSVDNLYALPALAEEYAGLQGNIDATMRELGAEYAVINYGGNTSTIQLLDLDGDGAQEAAAVFLRVTNAGDEKPLRVCVFRRTGEDDYRQVYTLEGEGSSINSVAYEDLTGDGSQEMIVSWQMGTGVYTLSAYALNLADSNELMSVAYNESYLTADLDQNGDREIIILQQDGSGAGSDRAEYYDFQDGSMVMTSSAPLSQGMRDVVSAKASHLSGGEPGVYVTLNLAEGQVTDVLALKDGALNNLTRGTDGDVSRATYREYTEVPPTDIDGDGVLEIPSPALLPPMNPESDSPQYLIRWKQFDGRGRSAVRCVTYHCTVDGWYLTLPDGWDGKIAAARDDSLSARGERAVVFYHRSGGEYRPFLTVYRLTGNNRRARANLSGRFILSNSDNSTIYCAALDSSVWSGGTNQEDLGRRFNLITVEWSAQ